jgi:hypothetical protein
MAQVFLIRRPRDENPARAEHTQHRPHRFVEVEHVLQDVGCENEIKRVGRVRKVFNARHRDVDPV